MPAASKLPGEMRQYLLGFLSKHTKVDLPFQAPRRSEIISVQIDEESMRITDNKKRKACSTLKL